MYHPTNALNARASRQFKNRRVRDSIGWLIRPMLFVRMAAIEKLQCTLKELADLFFGDLVRSEELVQVEVPEPAIGHARMQERPQAAGIKGTRPTASLPGP